jgi:methyl-accepting chemotaxis protein
MRLSDQLADFFERRLRLQDRPLIAKFAAAPIAMLALLLVSTAVSLGALVYASGVAGTIVDRDMRVVTALGSVSARFVRDDDALHRLVVERAAGDRSIDAVKQADQIKADLTRIHADLAHVRPLLPVAEQARAAHVIGQIERYGEAVDVVGSMLDVNFAASAAMLRPFRVNADTAIAETNRMVAEGLREAQAHAAAAARRTRYLIAVVAALVLTLVVIGIAVPVGIGKATIRSILAIADATRLIAERRFDIDLDRYARRDELGQIVAALRTFRVQLVEKEMLEQNALEEERRQAVAVAAANERNARDRDAMLGDLMREFEGKVRRMIAEAGTAVLRLEENATKLGKSVADANSLATELETLAESFSTEMNHAGAATAQLTAAIRQISGEATRSSEIAKTVSSRNASAKAEISLSEQRATEVERVVGVIDAIARQTSLLALNATIEAARHGGGGQGFGVVAREIKALASRTGLSTSDVRQQVRQVQDGMQRVVLETDELSKLLSEMSTIAARLSSTSSAQARSTGVIDERIDLIRTRVGRLTAVSGNIRKAAGLNDTSLIELRQNSRLLQDTLTFLNKESATFIGLLRNE